MKIFFSLLMKLKTKDFGIYPSNLFMLNIPFDEFDLLHTGYGMYITSFASFVWFYAKYIASLIHLYNSKNHINLQESNPDHAINIRKSSFMRFESISKNYLNVLKTFSLTHFSLSISISNWYNQAWQINFIITLFGMCVCVGECLF